MGGGRGSRVFLSIFLVLFGMWLNSIFNDLNRGKRFNNLPSSVRKEIVVYELKIKSNHAAMTKVMGNDNNETQRLIDESLAYIDSLQDIFPDLKDLKSNFEAHGKLVSKLIEADLEESEIEKRMTKQIYNNETNEKDEFFYRGVDTQLENFYNVLTEAKEYITKVSEYNVSVRSMFKKQTDDFVKKMQMWKKNINAIGVKYINKTGITEIIDILNSNIPRFKTLKKF